MSLEGFHAFNRSLRLSLLVLSWTPEYAEAGDPEAGDGGTGFS